MQVQHKFISFAEFKAINEDGPGGWRGYLSKTGEIDDGGDLIPQGAYADTIEQFLSRGFNAESHDWTFSKMIGFPTAAKEDDIGLDVTSQFHGTPDAQLIRTKVSERIAAGKGVYMSIGYAPAATPIFIQPKDYAAQIPLYCRPDQVEANLAMAARFQKIRVLPKVELFEGSIVSVPMLRSAAVTSVKSASLHAEMKGIFEDALSEQTNSAWNLWSVFSGVRYNIIRLTRVAARMGMTYDYAGSVNEAVGELSERLISSMLAELEEIATSDVTEEYYDYEYLGVGKVPEAKLTADLTLSDNVEFVTDMNESVTHANKDLVRRLEARYELLKKENRAISTVRRERIKVNRDSLAEVVKDLDDLLTETEPKPKEDEEEKGKAVPTDDDIRYMVVQALVRDALRRKGEYSNEPIPAVA